MFPSTLGRFHANSTHVELWTLLTHLPIHFRLQRWVDLEKVEDSWFLGRFVGGVDGGTHAVGFIEQRGVDPMVLFVLRFILGNCEGIWERSERIWGGVVAILLHRWAINNYIAGIIIPTNHLFVLSLSGCCKLLVLDSVWRLTAFKIEWVRYFGFKCWI